MNLLIVGLAVLVGTWMVHQTEYALEYGRRFSTVMATTPHRLYMAPSGVVLGLAAGLFLVVSGSFLGVSRMKLGRVLVLLPPRLARQDHLCASVVSWRAVVRTTFVLALTQAAVYLLQENLEYLATVGAFPGFSVLVAPQHAAVIPLHFLAALCSSILLWTVAAWMGRSRRALGVARLLLGLVTRGDSVSRRHRPPQRYLPNRRCTAGIFSLRSPPRHA